MSCGNILYPLQVHHIVYMIKSINIMLLNSNGLFKRFHALNLHSKVFQANYSYFNVSAGCVQAVRKAW